VNSIQLQITADEDPYEGQQGSAGFYKQLSAIISQTNALTPQSDAFEYKLEHTIDGGNSITGFATKQIHICDSEDVGIANKVLVGGNGGVTEVIHY